MELSNWRPNTFGWPSVIIYVLSGWVGGINGALALLRQSSEKAVVTDFWVAWHARWSIRGEFQWVRTMNSFNPGNELRTCWDWRSSALAITSNSSSCCTLPSIEILLSIMTSSTICVGITNGCESIKDSLYYKSIDIQWWHYLTVVNSVRTSKRRSLKCRRIKTCENPQTLFVVESQIIIFKQSWY